MSLLSKGFGHGYSHKRGDTFELAGTIEVQEYGELVADMTGWTGTSQMRDSDGAVVADLIFEWLDPVARVAVLKADGSTKDWPLGHVEIDIEFTSPDGYVVSTNTIGITITRDVTR